MRTFATLTSICCAFAVQAETITLKHVATGRTFGPFDTAPGSLVVLGNSTFTVARAATTAAPGGEPQAPTSPLLKTLQTITIPQFEVRSANPDDCIMFLSESVRNSPSGKNINIVNRAKQGDPFSADIKTVDCSLKNVSAYQALAEVCAQAGLRMHEESGMIILKER